MTKLLYILFAVLIFGLAAAADDETRYKAKSYSGKNLDNKSLKARYYRTEKTGRHSQYSSSKKKSGGFWSFFGLGKTTKHKTVSDQNISEDRNYSDKPSKSLTVKKPQTKNLSGQEELITTEAPKGEKFKPSEKRPGRDPLLKPRQGIKVPLADKEKDKP